MKELAIKKLKKEFDNVYKNKDDSYLELIDFYTDKQTEEYYQWKFVTPDDGVTHIWRYYFADNKVVRRKKEWLD